MKALHPPPLRIQFDEEAHIGQDDEAGLGVDCGLMGKIYERDAFFFESVSAFFNQAFENGEGATTFGTGPNHGAAAQLQAIVDNSTAVIYVKDVDGKFILVNRPFEEMFHLSRGQIIGKTDFDIFPEADARRYRENDEKVLKIGKPIEVKEVIPQWDGSHIYTSVKFPLKDAGGIVYAEVGISTITDRTRSSESRRHLAAIVESSDDGIISKDLNGIITSWNRGAQRIYGYTADEILGKSVTVLIPPDLQHEEPAFLAHIRGGESVNHYETIRRRKDGSDVEVSLTVSPIRDETGRIVGASKIARDITVRRRLEMQQKVLYELVTTVNRAPAMPEIYEAALNAICCSQKTERAAILLPDPDGVMRFKAWRHLSEEYRTAAEKLMDVSYRECNFKLAYVPDVSKEPLEEHIRALITREGIWAAAMLPITYENRPLGRFSVYYDTPHDFTHEEMFTAQTIASQVAFAIERSERIAALREAVVQMEEFSYSISHDLRAPIRAMHGYAEVLLQDYGAQLDEKAKEYLDRIIQGGDRADRLIHDTLTYSRVSRREVPLRPVSLENLTREIVLQQTGVKSSPCAQVRIESPLLPVIGHEPSLMQAISNLLTNALKFVAPETRPHVCVRTELRGDDVRLWIEDNGIGIKPEHQRRLFGMFERIHTKENYEGTGIGLAIVRKAVERMGGTVGVESDGASGSKFWIQLPAATNV